MNKIILEDLKFILNNLINLNDNLISLSNTNIFLTGGTGFFGKWFLDSFIFINDYLKLNSKCTVLTRSSDRFLDKYSYYRGHNIDFVEGDIRNFSIPSEHYDYIIHAAAPADAKFERESPDEMYSIIVDGTKRIIEMSNKSKVNKLLFISSGAVYGIQPSDIDYINESYECKPANTNYGKAKRNSELMLLNSDINVSIARCFAFVGPYLNINIHFAIGNFIRDYINRNTIVIEGDGRPYRSYLYTSDLMIWLWTMLIKSKNRSVYNVGSKRDISIFDLAKIVAKQFDYKMDIKIMTKQNNNLPALRYVPDNSQIINELGVKENIFLEEAIRRTIKWNVEIKNENS